MAAARDRCPVQRQLRRGCAFCGGELHRVVAQHVVRVQVGHSCAADPQGIAHRGALFHQHIPEGEGDRIICVSRSLALDDFFGVNLVRFGDFAVAAVGRMAGGDLQGAVDGIKFSAGGNGAAADRNVATALDAVAFVIAAGGSGLHCAAADRNGALHAVDALASGSVDRVNKTIQMTDTGIHPGSGIGNARKEISKDTIGIPVIAIGVPTVVDASVIVADTINYMYKHYAFNKEYSNNPKSKLTFNNIDYLNKNIVINNKDKEDLFGLIGKLNSDEVKILINEVLNPIGYNLMVTPKEIDFVIDKLSTLISSSVNEILHNICK